MPHPDVPDQLDVSIEVDNDGTGNADLGNSRSGYEDPHGQYLVTQTMRDEFDSGAGYGTFALTNHGKPLVVDTWNCRISQGAEDGRVWFYVGFGKEEGGDRAGDRFWPQTGVRAGGGGGRVRASQDIDIPREPPVVFEHAQTMYVTMAGDSASSDTVKSRTALRFIDHALVDGSGRL